ncbi:MAG TPA: hypothetical protein VIZ17_18140 [Acetobacteraceae bacterium]
MTTFYVSAGTGNDSNAGTSVGAALASLQAAEQLVRPGDTVEVMNGTYTGPYYGDVLDITTSGTASKPITFEAAPGQHPIIDSSGTWNAIDIQASYINVQGFTVEGDAAKYTLAQAQAQELNPGNPVFNGNGIVTRPVTGGSAPNHIVIENNTVYNEPGGGIVANGSDYLQILNNVVHNTSNWSLYDTSGIGIYASVNSDTKPGVHSIISGNTSYANVNMIPDLYTNSITDGEGIGLDTNTNYVGVIEVEGNLTYGNSGPGIEDFKTNNAVITGNTSYGNLLNPADAGDGQIFINQSTGSQVYNNVTTGPGSSGGDPPPKLTMGPAAAIAGPQGWTIAAPGIQISDASPTPGLMTLTISDTTDNFVVNGQKYSGSVGGQTTGTEAQLNADLALIQLVATKNDTLTVTVTDQNGLSDQVAIPVTVSKAASDMKFIYNSAANVTAPAPSAAPVAYEAWTHGTGTLDVTDFRFGTDSLTLQPKVTVTGETVSAGLVALQLSNHAQILLHHS